MWFFIVNLLILLALCLLPFSLLGKALLVALWIIVFRLFFKHHTDELSIKVERFNTLLESGQEGFWRFELSKPMKTNLSEDEQIEWLYKYGYFAECNTTMAKMCGFSRPSEIVGKPLNFSISKTVVTELFLRMFIRKDYNLLNIESVETDDYGNLKYALASLFGVFSKGKLFRGWGSLKDITAIKKHELEKDKIISQAKIDKQTAELANKTKDHILGNVSHELRTPLVAIIGYSELLQEATKKEEIQKGIEVINRSAKSLLQLIEDLLTLSKVKEGTLLLHKEKFCLHESIHNVVELLQKRYEDKKLKIEIIGKPIGVYADRIKVEQILTNLISNAFKFTEKGGITIEFGKTEPNAFFFSVEDTGIGIAKKYLKKIYSPYFQIKQGRTGTGLGLHVVKTLVNLHKGRVNIESTFNKGSKFTISLPLNGNDLRILNKSFEGVHILLLEDDPNLGEIMKLILEREGALVTWAKSAKSVRKFLKTEKYDVFIFDISMEDENGMELMESLRDNGDLTPSVAISAYAEYAQPALASGFNLFILKPFSVDKLQEMKVVLPESH